MDKAKTLIWTPRIIAILFIAFLSIFAIDVFFEGYGFPEILVALFMHLLPSFLLVLLLIAAWKYPKIGGTVFIFFGFATIFFFHTYRDPIVMLLISLPPVIVGSLFVLSAKFMKK